MADLRSFVSTYTNAGANGVTFGANYGATDADAQGLGKAVAVFNIDMAVNGTNFSTTESDATGAVKAVLNEVAEYVTITGRSPLRTDGSNPGQIMTVVVEGDFGTLDYNGDGSATTLAAELQARIRELTTAGNGPVNLNSATVTLADGFPIDAE